MSARYRLGALDLAVLSDGDYYVDAGACFGIIPRVLWEPHAGPLDDHHRMQIGLNCLLLRSQGRVVLIESGLGDKQGARRFASPAAQGNLLGELAALGVAPADIDIVVNTHLHADHCGWNTRSVDGALVPTFPNAAYWVMREEWQAANAPDERTRATYLTDNLAPIEASGRLCLADGEKHLTDELTLLPAPGHSAGHAAVVIASGGETALYIGDLAQTPAQIERTAWVSAFDILPLVTMETKRRLLAETVARQSLIVSVHAPFPGLGRLSEAPGGRRHWTPVAADETSGAFVA